MPVPSGRIADQGRVRLRTALREVVTRWGANPVLTPQQDVILADLPAAVGRALETMPDAEALPGVWASQRTDPGLLLSGVVTPEVPWDEAMAALDVPALLLTGDRPGSARVGSEGLATASRNPRITPVLVPGAGHQVRRSVPQAFYRAVDAWLAEVLPVD